MACEIKTNVEKFPTTETRSYIGPYNYTGVPQEGINQLSNANNIVRIDSMPRISPVEKHGFLILLAILAVLIWSK